MLLILREVGDVEKLLGRFVFATDTTNTVRHLFFAPISSGDHLLNFTIQCLFGPRRPPEIHNSIIVFVAIDMINRILVFRVLNKTLCDQTMDLKSPIVWLETDTAIPISVGMLLQDLLVTVRIDISILTDRIVGMMFNHSPLRHYLVIEAKL